MYPVTVKLYQLRQDVKKIAAPLLLLLLLPLVNVSELSDQSCQLPRIFTSAVFRTNFDTFRYFTRHKVVFLKLTNN